MAFREKIELLIDVTTTGARSSLRQLKGDIDEADGAFGKIKAGAEGVFGGLGGIVAGGVAAAGSAIAGFGLKAIGDFQDVALAAGEMGDKLGLPVEDASRLMEVAGDLGIEVGTLELAIGRMNLTAGKSPEKFDGIGASIARNKDGTINVTETFKNAAEAIERIPDAAGRAKAAQEIFGKGWQGVAEMISGGANGITDAMASVENAKVIDEDEVEKARKFRDMMDALKGKFESFALTVGEVLVDAAAGFEIVIGKAETLARWLTFRDARQLIYDNAIEPIKELGGEIDATYNQGLSLIIQGLKDMGRIAEVQPLIDKFTALGVALGNGVDELVHYGPGLEDFGDQAGETAKKILENRDAIDAMNESLDNAPLAAAITTGDEYFQSLNGLRNIASDAEEAIANFGETVQEEVDGNLARLPFTLDAGTEAGRRQIDALGPLSDMVGVQLADAYVQADGDQSKFMLNAKKVGDDVLGRLQREFGLTDDEVNELRKSLGLTAKDYEARFKLAGDEEARVKIGLLQTSIDNLPRDVQTKVTQQILYGDYQGAVATIQAYNNNHPTSVKVDAQGGDVAAGRNAVQAYNNNNPTTVRVNPIGGMSGSNRAEAGGGTTYVPGGQMTLVGENGPEILRLPTGSQVYSNAESRAMGMGGGGSPYNITINNNGRDITSHDVAMAIRQAQLAS